MTSISNSTAVSETRSSRWLGAALLVVVLLAFAGGGWLLWQSFVGPRESAELDVGTIPDRFRPLRAAGANPPPRPVYKDGIQTAGIGFYRVQQGEFFMTLAASETSFAPVQLMCSRAELMSQEQRRLIRFCNETANAGFAKQLDLTDEQTKKLATIRQASRGGMKLEEADRTRLRDLWKAWITTKDPAAKKPCEEALLAAVKEVGARAMEPTKKHYADLAAEVRTVVSDAQLNKYRQLRGQ